MKRVLYLLYYLRQLDRAKLKSFMAHVRREKKWSSFQILSDALFSVLKYNISILEYFQFHFYKASAREKATWAGTGYMYEYQLKMNPKPYRPILEDKRLFLDRFKSFIRHAHVSLEDLKKDVTLSSSVLVNRSGKIVLKSHDGQCGSGVEVIEAVGMSGSDLLSKLEKGGNDLVEEYVMQHPDLMVLSPSGLNTIRIFTQLNAQDEVEVLGCRLRITVNSHIDNLAAGNIAAPIDETTGKVTGSGVYSDITKVDETSHPVTKVPIIGFQVPKWKETISMVKQAALSYKECRSIGWDIAITLEGPELIEGNHDWCKLLWQLPVKKGLKPVLERYKKSI